MIITSKPLERFSCIKYNGVIHKLVVNEAWLLEG